MTPLWFALIILGVIAGSIVLLVWSACRLSGQSDRRAERILAEECTRRRLAGSCPCWRHAAREEERY